MVVAYADHTTDSLTSMPQPDPLNEASLGALLTTWNDVRNDMQHVDEITAPVQPEAVREALHASIVSDYTTIHDELIRRERLTQIASIHSHGDEPQMFT